MTLFFSRICDDSIIDLTSNTKGIELGPEEIETLLEKTLNGEQQKFLDSGSVDAYCWCRDNEVTSGNTTCGQKNRVRARLLPNKAILVDNDQVRTSRGRVDERGTTNEFQRSRKQTMKAKNQKIIALNIVTNISENDLPDIALALHKTQ